MDRRAWTRPRPAGSLGPSPVPEPVGVLRGAAWLVVVAGIVLAAFAPVVLGRRTLLAGDVARLYEPVRGLVVEALRGGRLPLWNPHLGTGKALFAEGVHGVLHPISLLGALVAPASLDFLLLAYLVCAAVGTCVLARALACSPAASAAAGCAYALAGFTVSMTGNLVFLAGAATVPWTLAGLRACRHGGGLRIAAAAVAVAASAASGDVQVAIVGVLLGLALAGDGGWRAVGRAAAGVAIGVLLAAVQVAASYGELAVTYRGVGLTPADARSWALSPWRLVELVAPGFFRADLTREFAPVHFALDPASAAAERLVPFADSVFVGAAVLALAVLAARSRVRVVLAVGAVAATWLALGHHAGARQLLVAVPVWSAFRYSEKLVGPLTLCLALLAALGLDRVAREGLSRPARRGLLVAAGLAGGVAFLCAVAPEVAAAPLRAAGAPAPAAREGVAHLATGALYAAGALVFLLGAGLAPAAVRGPLLFVAVAIQSLVATPFARRLEDPGAFRVGPPPLVADPPGPRVGRVEPSYLVDPAGPAADRTRLVALAWRSATPATNVAARLDTVDDYSGFDARRHTNLLRSSGEAFPLLARRFATTHVAVVGRDESPEMAARAAAAVEGGRRVFEDGSLGLELWEVPHRPWASFAPRAVTAGDPGAARDRLLALHAAGDVESVVVEAAEPPACAGGRVLSVERRAESARVEAEADGEALLVVNDAYWPGWRATIDGVEAPILAADVLVRAVRWPRGRHVLELRYDPPEVRLGWALSALGAALAAGVAARDLASRRRRAGRTLA